MTYISIILIGVFINMLLAGSQYLVMSSGQLSIALAGFCAIGAYVAAIGTVLWGMPLYLAVIIGTLCAGVCGLLLGLPTLRLRGIYFAIATLAFAEVVRGMTGMLKVGHVGLEGRWVGPDYHLGFRDINYLSMHGIGTIEFLGVVLGCLTLVAVFLYLAERSKYGLALRAIEQNESAAMAAGIDVAGTKVSAFIISAMIAGLAGGLYAHYITYIGPEQFSFGLTAFIIVFVIVGGRDSFWGALAGAAVLSLMPEIFRPLSKFRMQGYALLVVIMIIWRPRGIFDRTKISRLKFLLMKKRYAED